MESFIDNCINKLKLKRFQVAKIPKNKKIPHFHHGNYDGEREDWCKQWRKENEINIITASSIRSRLKVFEFNSSSIKHKGDLSKKRAMKNLFELIEEESKENIEIDELQPNFSPGNFINEIFMIYINGNSK